jgi:hypothetical protein
MSIFSVQSNEPMQESSPPDVGSAAEIPAWLAVRRARQSTGATTAEANVEHPLPATQSQESNRPPILKPRPTTSSIVLKDLNYKSNVKKSRKSSWLIRWLSSHTAIGFLVSLSVHSIVLLALAFVLVANVASRESISLWGVLGDGDEMGSEILIDTSLPIDAGESAPLPTAELAQAADLSDSGTKVPESIRFGFGGKGHGEGEAGEGTSIGVPTLKVPGHAQTKGSFSAWTDPRDPKPNENYAIVIQIRLPSRVKIFHGSDLSGLVIGTDRYRQEIHFNSDDQFPVEKGVVEIRIPVPGGAFRVRDTIQIKSKLLGEKQRFEIEF